MDIYNYDEDNLSAVAGNCRYLKCKQHRSEGAGHMGISCGICQNWNGRSCIRKQYDDLASELHLD